MTEKLHNEVIIARPKPFFYVGVVAKICKEHDDIVMMAKDGNRGIMLEVVDLLKNFRCFDFYEEPERKHVTDKFGNKFHTHIVRIERVGVLRSD